MEHTQENGYNNGLLYEGSPQKVPSRALFERAQGAGKPIMKAKEITVYESPSPHSKLISHSPSALAPLAELGKAQDIDGLMRMLDKPDLLPAESLVKLLAVEIQKREKVMQILRTGTSPLILSFECLEQVESGIGPIYRDRISKLEHTVLKAFGKVIKTFQRSQPDPFTVRITGEDHKVCAKVDIGTFGAALYHFVKHRRQHIEQGNVPYSKETAKALAGPLLKVYREIMKEYVMSLSNVSSGMVDAADDPIHLREWSAFFERRMQCDHKGGHCAAWRDGYPDEAARLMHVKQLFAGMVDVKMPELEKFAFLKQLVVPHMDMYIAKKQAQHSKKRAAEDMSSDELDSILREWRSS